MTHGAPVYAFKLRLLEVSPPVLRTLTHKEYESMLQWLGGQFDAEKFNPKRVKFDDPDRRYELAFDKPPRRSRPARRTTRPDNSRLPRSRARRPRR